MSMGRSTRAGQILWEAGTPARPSATAAWWAVAAIALVALGGIWIRFGELGALPVDRWWHGAVEAAPGTLLFAVAIALADIGGSVGGATTAAIAGAALFALRRPRDAFAVMLAALLGVVASELLKVVVERGRPSDPLYHATGLSYPSGHSMGAAALACSLFLVLLGAEGVRRELVRAAGILAAAWILAMMWSRTALHVHWLTDTLAGALLGIAVALIARRIAIRPRIRGGITTSRPGTRTR